MSASRDKTQKIAFVYSNLYQLYKKGKEAATQAEVPAANQPSQAEAKAAAPTASAQAPSAPVTGLTTAKVIKADDLSAPFAKVSNYTPIEFLKSREKPAAVAPQIVEKPLALRQAEAVSAEHRSSDAAHQNVVQNHALNSLKSNLQTLSDLHERLQFMLKELEDLVKE